MKERGESILVTMREDCSTTFVLKNLLRNHVEEYNDFEYTIVDKRKALLIAKKKMMPSKQKLNSK